MTLSPDFRAEWQVLCDDCCQPVGDSLNYIDHRAICEDCINRRIQDESR